MIFDETRHALKTEKIFHEQGIDVKLVAPPMRFRLGCDLAVMVDIMEKPALERLLSSKGIPFVDIIPLDSDVCRPVSILKRVDYDEATMIKAANMKMVFNRSTGRIVNISGGGCPDVPYLYSSLVNKHLNEVERPARLGFTLCAMMLDKAFIECRRVYNGD